MHIADVSHFIRPGTAIDKEAADRSTTVYLTDRRIDMASNRALLLYYASYFLRIMLFR